MHAFDSQIQHYRRASQISVRLLPVRQPICEDTGTGKEGDLIHSHLPRATTFTVYQPHVLSHNTTHHTTQMFHPSDVRKAADIVLGGLKDFAVMQPHEAHIPYRLQFMADHNL